MIFHSLDFVAFFVVVVALYWRLGHRLQNLLLLGASYLFYGYVHPWFVSLVFATTVVDYWAARGMEERPRHKRLWLALSLAANLGTLGFFKYFDFFLANVGAVLRSARIATSPSALAILLPVGISFYTFQELTYTIDVYHGRMRARRSFIDFAAFVAFFPQLVAGPIERASRLLPQVEGRRHFSWSIARDAMSLMLWGYFKKLVIADNVGVIANKVFALSTPGFTVLWAGVFAFGIQIYADFSAYSDIARGAAQWLGFDLMRNFDHPYSARGPADFWRRWHISLSSWFRDYVYVPLGGARAGWFARIRNVLATFLLSGLWHGASWNYVLWGAFHGSLLLLARTFAPLAPRSRRWTILAAPFQITLTFLLVHVGWLMFRETDTAMLFRDLALSPFKTSLLDRQAGAYLIVVSALYSLPLWLHTLWSAIQDRSRPVATAKGTGRLAFETAVCGLLFAVMLVFRSQTSLDFIYFQF